MMDESQVRKLVNDNLKQMRWALQLQDWDVDIVYAHTDDGTQAECTPGPGHRNAEIVLVPPSQKNQEDTLKSLQHELLHLFPADFEIYRKAVGQLLDDKDFNAIDEFFRYAVERTVNQIERMLDHGLKISPEDLCAPAQQGEMTHALHN